MNDSEKLRYRFFLFIFGCIGTRLSITTISAYASNTFLKIIGIGALIPVFGWLYIMFIGKRDTGLEVFGEKIWWKDLRPLHTLLWAIFSYTAISGNRKAWIVLFIDTMIGLSAFLIHHGQQGDFKLLL